MAGKLNLYFEPNSINMKYSLFAIALLFMVACNDGDSSNDNERERTMEDPSRVHPEEQTIPDSMSIHNDSLIIHDSTNH